MSSSNEYQTPFLSKPTIELLEDFGKGKAAPGSGSASALMGLLASQLIITVCSISSTKTIREKHHPKFMEIKSDIVDGIEPKLRNLFEEDAAVFERVFQLRVERNNSSDKPIKLMKDCESNQLLETATDYLFEIVELCLKLIEYGVFILEHGSHHVRGDSGAAINASLAGASSGICIANVNFIKLKDSQYAKLNVEKCKNLNDRLLVIKEQASKLLLYVTK